MNKKRGRSPFRIVCHPELVSGSENRLVIFRINLVQHFNDPIVIYSTDKWKSGSTTHNPFRHLFIYLLGYFNDNLYGFGHLFLSSIIEVAASVKKVLAHASPPFPA